MQRWGSGAITSLLTLMILVFVAAARIEARRRSIASCP
jgi:hypothetical protein